ncbi:MAG: hypothetical protein J6Z49_00650 [Kiritimatiellae bacterium]|nr:hypothetical protein [Kiritimatiellia bacterium]
MSDLLYFAAWEWINIALEYTATAWTRLPYLLPVVIGVNLATHPLFVFLLEHYGRALPFVLACEGVIVLVEWVLLIAVYGRQKRPGFLACLSLLMNGASYGTGVLLSL